MSEYVIHIEDAKTLYKYTDFDFPLDAYLREEIVRCRDCKYYDMTGPWCFEPSKVYIDEYGIEVCATVEPDGYCAWAEPKVGVR